MTPKLRPPARRSNAATVRSPADGYVLDLTQFTVGGVVGAGERLMSVVPANAPLIVSSRIKPQDIDVVKPGMEARVRLSAFNSRTAPPVNATVTTVSADQLVDEKTGEGYFRADLKIEPRELTKLPKGAKLSPGMPAETMIVTGNRSILPTSSAPLPTRSGTPSARTKRLIFACAHRRVGEVSHPLFGVAHPPASDTSSSGSFNLRHDPVVARKGPLGLLHWKMVARRFGGPCGHRLERNMAEFIFETMTQAEATAFGAADTLKFNTAGANGSQVIVAFTNTSFPDPVVNTATLTFGSARA